MPEFGTWLLGRRRSLQVAGARMQRARATGTFAPAGRVAVADMVGLGRQMLDAGRPAAALHELDAAARLAQDADRPRMLALALALAFRARARLQRDENDRAVDDIDAARALVTSLGWTAVRPWIDTLHAEVLLRPGRAAEAEQVVGDARALAEVLDDTCWRALTTRGLAQVHAARARHARRPRCSPGPAPPSRAAGTCACGSS